MHHTKQIKSFSGNQEVFFAQFLRKNVSLSVSNHKRILFSSKKQLSSLLLFALKIKLFDKDKKHQLAVKIVNDISKYKTGLDRQAKPVLNISEYKNVGQSDVAIAGIYFPF